MHLFEAIIDANHRAVAGDANACLHPADFADELPVIALTCVDPRLNAFFPNVLGIPAEHFIWLRNAGNIVTGPLSSTMRSLALACAVKGGREIAVIGHTDCQVCRTTTMQLLDRLRELGVDRHRLPENINDFFGMFGSERQNVIKACDFIRQSPLIGPQMPVHGFLVDIETGKLEWLVNGYQTLVMMSSRAGEISHAAGPVADMMRPLEDFKMGEMKFPESKIGDASAKVGEWSPPPGAKPGQPPPTPRLAGGIAQRVAELGGKGWQKPEPAVPPKIPLPPPITPRPTIRRK